MVGNTGFGDRETGAGAVFTASPASQEVKGSRLSVRLGDTQTHPIEDESFASVTLQFCVT